LKAHRVYDNWKESIFIKRLNRFTILVELKKDQRINAYLPNTGRLQEHLIPGHKIFLTKIKTEKFDYKAVASYYQGSYVFLDTVKLNRMFELFINNDLIEEFNHPVLTCREYTIENHRYDFFLRDRLNNRNLIEIKSCTLCHNHTAMFPDAPSKRALSHIFHLSGLENLSYKPWIIFLISHSRAERFIPNLHTDPEFTEALIKLKNLNIAAFRYEMIDPVTVDLDSLYRINLDLKSAKDHLTISGSYLLILENHEDINIKIGQLGKISFKKGYYVYIGSAMNGLDQRLNRHHRSLKKKRWHIDYISPNPMRLIKDFKIRRRDRVEDKIADDLMKIADGYILNFGSSDSRLKSHLLFFKKSPLQNQLFIKVILNYQTFTENLIL